jgi:coatomer protein complex subunit gamma
LAITTLLKTGSEGNIDRLMKQIASFMPEITDEFRIVVVNAIRELCLKYPSRHITLLLFLSGILRDEGGLEFKQTIVDTIIEIIEHVPESKEMALYHLCEFIEDCEFTCLSIQILHLLGVSGPKTSDPAKYIRFIFNRVILENATVRAAAVSALTSFGLKVERLRSAVIVLLQRSLADDDDEVRDRATVSLSMLKLQDPSVAAAANEKLPMDWASLNAAVAAYSARPANGPLTFDSLPHMEVPAEPVPLPSASTAAATAKKPAGPTAAAPVENSAAEALYKVPEFATLGGLFRSTKQVNLTESESEYVVTCIKHIFAEHVVFQFNITNTLDDMQLEDAYVAMTSTDPSYKVLNVIPAKVLKCNVPGISYTSVKRDPQQGFPASTFQCELKFTSKEVDSSGAVDEDGRQEEYPAEDVEISPSDFMAKVAVADFRKSWEVLGEGGELSEKFALNFKTLEDAVNGVVEYVGMQPVEGTSTVAAGAKQHLVLLSGVFIGGVKVLARAHVGYTAEHGCVMKLDIRSEDSYVSEVVSGCIQ